jgi:hypothetical protein
MTNFKTVAAAMMMAIGGSTIAHTTVLTPTDWEAIEQQAELARLETIEEIPAVRIVTQQELYLQLTPQKKTTMVLNAPFLDEELVGLTVIDKYGHVVYKTFGKYADLKNYTLRDFDYKEMQYVVRLYNDQSIYETSLLVVNP